jgi:hypothetical protein
VLEIFDGSWEFPGDNEMTDIGRHSGPLRNKTPDSEISGRKIFSE